MLSYGWHVLQGFRTKVGRYAWYLVFLCQDTQGSSPGIHHSPYDPITCCTRCPEWSSCPPKRQTPLDVRAVLGARVSLIGTTRENASHAHIPTLRTMGGLICSIKPEIKMSCWGFHAVAKSRSLHCRWVFIIVLLEVHYQRSDLRTLLQNRIHKFTEYFLCPWCLTSQTVSFAKSQVQHYSLWWI